MTKKGKKEVLEDTCSPEEEVYLAFAKECEEKRIEREMERRELQLMIRVLKRDKDLLVRVLKAVVKELE